MPVPPQDLGQNVVFGREQEQASFTQMRPRTFRIDVEVFRDVGRLIGEDLDDLLSQDVRLESSLHNLQLSGEVAFVTIGPDIRTTSGRLRPSGRRKPP